MEGPDVCLRSARLRIVLEGLAERDPDGEREQQARGDEQAARAPAPRAPAGARPGRLDHGS
jgi:hypothetical protein